MEATVLHRATVAKDVILDGRLALFHNQQRWLAVADLHFGYELSQRKAGNLFPWFGMEAVTTRLQTLLAEYQPRQLILLGDLVHNRAGASELTALVAELRKNCEVLLIAGNHDRYLGRGDLVESWTTGGFLFHHGHCASQGNGEIQIVGHHHPAGVLRDGAGLRLKLPAFVQQKKCWIMPAFSPWAAGTEWRGDEEDAVWLCSPQRVLRLGAN